jgi:allophanate hydrolase subunit 1
MSFYLHHVPGRLRIQTPELQNSEIAARAACGTLEMLDGVANTRVNPAIGSLLVEYDRRRLKPGSLWDVLCACGLVSGAKPISDDDAVTRITRCGEKATETHSELVAAVAGIAAEKVIERVAIALIRTLI